MSPLILLSHTPKCRVAINININHIIDAHQHLCANKINVCQDPFLLSPGSSAPPGSVFTNVNVHQNIARMASVIVGFALSLPNWVESKLDALGDSRLHS